MSPVPPHAPEEGWDSGVAEDDRGYYRTVLSDNDDLIFQGLFTRLGFGRRMAREVWSLVRGRPWGETRITPHDRAARYEFITNDSHARREPLGALTVRWRRLPTSSRLIDLEIVNALPDDDAATEEVDSSRLV